MRTGKKPATAARMLPARICATTSKCIERTAHSE
jgi:hypothetical protein